MDKVKFIYFEGCPKAKKVMDILKTLNISLDIIDQNKLPEDSLYKDYSSPTVIVGKEIIYGSQAKGGGCSLEKASKYYFKQKLKQGT